MGVEQILCYNNYIFKVYYRKLPYTILSMYTCSWYWQISWSAELPLSDPHSAMDTIYINWYYAENNYATLGLISRKINKLLCTSVWAFSISIFQYFDTAECNLHRSFRWFVGRFGRFLAFPLVWVCHPSPTGCFGGFSGSAASRLRLQKSTGTSCKLQLAVAAGSSRTNFGFVCNFAIVSLEK